MSTQRFSASRLLSIRDYGTYRSLAFHCPGCERRHVIDVDRPQAWTFDGNEDAPTFAPSILAQGVRDITDDEIARIMGGEKLSIPELCCHSFVRGGQIQYLSDCSHALAGQTVPMVPIPDKFDD